MGDGGERPLLLALAFNPLSMQCHQQIVFRQGLSQAPQSNQNVRTKSGFATCPPGPGGQWRNADSERQLEIRRVDLLCLVEDGQELPTLTASEPHKAGENIAAQMDRRPNVIYVGAPH